MDYEIQLYKQAQQQELSQFYKRNNYKGKVKSTDRVWVVVDSDAQIIGAARFCHNAGLSILRGVWVEECLRQQGIGSQLLHALKLSGDIEGCYCFPYLYLEAFYQKQGFRLVEQAPASLQKLLTRYNHHEEKVILMGMPLV